MDETIRRFVLNHLGDTMHLVRFERLWMVLLIVGCLGLIGCGGSQRAADTGDENVVKTVEKGRHALSLEELAGWMFLGEGSVRIDTGENALFMTETTGSKGVTLVSHAIFPENMVLTFKVKPLSYESVNVVVISASDSTTGGAFEVPVGYDGGFDFWTAGTINNYVFAFHNNAHNRKPFIVKDPGMQLLVESDANVMGEQWHSIEIGRAGKRLWLKIDGNSVVEAIDSSETALPGGVIGFRLRGTPDAVASALFKDVVVDVK